MLDCYSICNRQVLPSSWTSSTVYDLLMTAVHHDERSRIFDSKLKARQTLSIMFPEYGIDKTNIPPNVFHDDSCVGEAEFVLRMLASQNIDWKNASIALDISAFIAPYLIFLVLWLKRQGVGKFDAFYCEPRLYSRKEHTKFSAETATSVRQVSGFEGSHGPDTSRDILIMGMGYDHQLVKAVAEHKESARKIQLFGFPSLQADMYQESVLRANLAVESIGRGAEEHQDTYFVPAYDPFVTASRLREIVRKERQQYPDRNIYLCPLATKPQALGFALYFVTECNGTPTSMLYPICASYPSSTSEGVGRLWQYEVELDLIA